MSYNHKVEAFRDDEYPMLKGKAYLDHAGTTVCAKSLVLKFSENMISNLYGNPHSDSVPAKFSGDMVDSVRLQTLHFFNADPDHFDVIFTANATAAIKLVGECFRDLAHSSSASGKFNYYFHKDAHTSLVGVRELAGNTVCLRSDNEVEAWLKGAPTSGDDNRLIGLFAYPGQSNMTGRRLPLSWPRQLRQASHSPRLQNTYSLLDAAALATTCPLDFSDPDSAPDFTALSFYKIFGFPDLGALIVRKSSGHILSWRRYFGGGTVDMVEIFHEASVQRKTANLHDALEDGTLPFHSIMALGCAFDVHKKLYGSMKKISKHTLFLANRLYRGMQKLRYCNGRQVCEIYNDEASAVPYTIAATQGATIAFNVIDSQGTLLGHALIEQLASQKNIFLRAGGLCNPGGIATYLKLEPWQFKRAFSAGYKCGGADEDLQVISGKRTGVVRASLGAMSTLSDVDALLTFLHEMFVLADPLEKRLFSEKRTVNTPRTGHVEVAGPHQKLEPIGVLLVDRIQQCGYDSGYQEEPEVGDCAMGVNRARIPTADSSRGGEMSPEGERQNRGTPDERISVDDYRVGGYSYEILEKRKLVTSKASFRNLFNVFRKSPPRGQRV